MKTIKELEEEIKEPCKDYDLPKGNPWTDVIKEGCKKEARLKVGVLKDVLKLIDKMSFGNENKGRFNTLQQLKDAISGGSE